MCDRYVFVQKASVIRKRFQVFVPGNIQWIPSYNIAPGKYAPVITSQQPETLLHYIWGSMPFPTEDKNLFVSHIDAKDLELPTPTTSIRYLIQQQRCLVPADAYIQGTKGHGLSKPFLVYLRKKARPFAFAGIHDTRLDEITGELIRSFAVITTTANELLRKLPCDRSPVILLEEQEKAWLNPSTPLTEIMAMLQPFPAEHMNAYPIAPTIKNPQADDPGLIHPAGPRLVPETKN
ncbi:SOS response-associated peptidase [Prolixibacter denitrificans]|uniref:Abasic site processing protein n=2 Tax=Prolixibacter denitrificans TaxID=1541063 RepID=A0A2P8CEH3_9BACT|nr:SOS response-associated peptidase [Prolixibacter denitrificans]PSK83366.1 putative SOS response-associated peptidase YedK [Prolixibacter denitrificans]